MERFLSVSRKSLDNTVKNRRNAISLLKKSLCSVSKGNSNM